MHSNTIITMTEETFSRTDSGKSWKTKPDTTETEQITPEQYANINDKETQQWFRRIGGSETAQRDYTNAGYLITRLTSCCPSRQTKRVRTFKFEINR